MAWPYACRLLAAAALVFTLPPVGRPASDAAPPGGHAALVKLFQEWRAFEHPAMKGDVADYSAGAMAAKAAALRQWRRRLDDLDTRGWTIEEINDRKLVAAEMSGLDFNLRVLRPWARDPAFYVSIWSSRTL